MQQELKDKVRFLVGDADILEQMRETAGFEPFAPETVEFLDEFSKLLRGDADAGKYSDVQTFAFWCRKSSVLRMKENYGGSLKNRTGRGLAFHVAPSNIPMMFLFSMAVALLAGNSSIVRVSSREFEQSTAACRLLQKLLGDHPEEAGKIVILRYPHEEELTRYFSAVCDSRIIWGGDRSIGEIRKLPLPPHGIDLPFYDRFSFCVINSAEYLKYGKKQLLAENFYNDTYFTDQNACTSPQLVVWTKEGAAEARRQFWEELEKVVSRKYRFQDIQGVDKLAAACRYAVCHSDGKAFCTDKSLCRVEIGALHKDLKDFRCPGGYFYEYAAERLDEIAEVCTKECQTISYFGFDRQELLDVVKRNRCRGVDRIVPIGKTMDFGLQWDGFDFIYSLSKVIG